MGVELLGRLLPGGHSGGCERVRERVREKWRGGVDEGEGLELGEEEEGQREVE